ncbi:hypothetical protein GQ54DRAFT_329870 [Martensiomyces pterosporus]|nr:hypothetical protein GQ54DRAFT_329870 [Martensiomyces pterosporus]
MSTHKPDTVSALLSLVGDATVGSAEDLVVAICQAVLLGLGLTPANSTDAWTSPGLSHNQCSATYSHASGTIEVKWVSLAGSVVMLAAPLPKTGGTVSSIQINTDSIVLHRTMFPLKFGSSDAAQATESANSAISGSALLLVSADIREKLLAGIAPSQPAKETLVAAASARGQRGSGDNAPGASTSEPEPPLHLGVPQGARQPPIRAEVGGDDLNPVGRLFVSPASGLGEGGMIVGPGHPMFRRDDDDGFNGPEFPGGPQALPPGAVPPGARFDPVGPFGQAPGPQRPSGGGLPGRRGPQRGGRGPGPLPGPGGFFSGDPDPDMGGPPDSSWNYYL